MAKTQDERIASMTISAETALIKEFKAMCDAEDKSYSKVVVRMLKKYLDENRKKGGK